jgi:hypothetical protein
MATQVFNIYNIFAPPFLRITICTKIEALVGLSNGTTTLKSRKTDGDGL